MALTSVEVLHTSQVVEFNNLLADGAFYSHLINHFTLWIGLCHA